VIIEAARTMQMTDECGSIRKNMLSISMKSSHIGRKFHIATWTHFLPPALPKDPTDTHAIGAANAALAAALSADAASSVRRYQAMELWWTSSDGRRLVISVDDAGRCWSPASIIEQYCIDFGLPFEITSLISLSLVSRHVINDTRLLLDMAPSMKDYQRKQALYIKRLSPALPPAIAAQSVLVTLIRLYVGDGFDIPSASTSKSSSQKNTGVTSTRRRFKGVPFVL
jgi:hypothetical protein